MNRTELVDDILKHTALWPAATDLAVIAFIEAIERALKRGDDVVLKGFGTFRRVDKPPRKGRNPRTGQPCDIPAQSTVKFIPSAAMKALIATAETPAK